MLSETHLTCLCKRFDNAQVSIFLVRKVFIQLTLGTFWKAHASANNQISFPICQLQLPWCLNGGGNYCKQKMSKAERRDASKDKDFVCHNYFSAAFSWSDLIDNVWKYYLGMLKPNFKVKWKQTGIQTSMWKKNGFRYIHVAVTDADKSWRYASGNVT